MHFWCGPWEHQTGIKFRAVKQGRGDIHIAYRDIDGPGKTLGMAFLPAQTVDFMERGGTVSGDIFIDRLDRWQFPEQVHAVGVHEVGHAIGLPHITPGTAVMFQFSDGRYRLLHIADIRIGSARYPRIRS